MSDTEPTYEAATAWLAEKLRDLAQSFDKGEVLAFHASIPAQMRELPHVSSQGLVQHEFTSVKELHVVYTTEERAVALVNEQSEAEENRMMECAGARDE